MFLIDVDVKVALRLFAIYPAGKHQRQTFAGNDGGC